MKAYMDGDQICIVDSTFVDLQESDDVLFLDPKKLHKEQLWNIAELMEWKDVKLMWKHSLFSDETYLRRHGE